MNRLPASLARWFFAFFLVSGFCSLVYEVVWLRLAMASFGVTTPLVAIVLSVFMAGLALGSWGGGRLARFLGENGVVGALRLYALAELLIGVSGLVVAAELRVGRGVLQRLGGEAAWGSSAHYAASGAVVAAALLPFCACMGATFPLAMAALRGSRLPGASGGAFSYLYVANVIGATSGTLISALFLIELLGFLRTLLVTAALNGALAAAALVLSWVRSGDRDAEESRSSSDRAAQPDREIEAGSLSSSLQEPARRAGAGLGDIPAAGSAAGASEGRGAGTGVSRGAGGVGTAGAGASDGSGRAPGAAGSPAPRAGAAVLWLLFTTGFLSLAMEVVWVRQFTPYLGTVVYAFAGILAIYLTATFLGSAAYRARSRVRAASDSGDHGVGRESRDRRGARDPRGQREARRRRHPRDPRDRRDSGRGSLARPFAIGILLGIGLLSLLPVVFADPRLTSGGVFGVAVARVIAGLAPFSFAVGYLTPMLVDRWSGGDPARVGTAYAANVVGCILGPLLSSFVLLPSLSERWSIAVLSLPLFGFGLVAGRALAAGRPGASEGREEKESGETRRDMASAVVPVVAAIAAAGVLVTLARDYEAAFPERRVERDYSATVIATGEGMRKQLLVNGYGMTVLTPITKMMAHLPLSLRQSPPRNALVICFGMGTSFRSALSWDIPVTAVELIPSVPRLFPYYHADADRVAAQAGARIVIDDGRRFLERTAERYDVITVDPPPPVESAGSSLLYSREFFQLAHDRLSPDGILQHWLPTAEPIVISSVARSIRQVFPDVRAFRSEAGWGLHFLASPAPLPRATPEDLAARQPARAAADLVEWQRRSRPIDHFAAVLGHEVPIDDLVRLSPEAPPLEDDRPVNEYYLLRRMRASPGTSPAAP